MTRTHEGLQEVALAREVLRMGQPERAPLLAPDRTTTRWMLTTNQYVDFRCCDCSAISSNERVLMPFR
jgi:hypothetical protein